MNIPILGEGFTVTYTATNSLGTDTRVVSYFVSNENAPQFSAFTATTLTESVAYDQTVTATGDTTPTITSRVSSGTLPTGLTLSNARLHGTPTGIPDRGIYFTVTFTATSSGGRDILTVPFFVRNATASPVFSAFTATALTEDVAYDQTITATGTPAPTITSSVTTGTLPTGLTLSNARLHGTPTGIPDGGSTFSVTFTATNSDGTVQTTVTFTVAGA